MLKKYWQFITEAQGQAPPAQAPPAQAQQQSQPGAPVHGQPAASGETQAQSGTTKGEYKPGDNLKYTRKNGEENEAKVADDQTDVNDDMIRMVSLKDESRIFMIPKSSIISGGEEAPPEGEEPPAGEGAPESAPAQTQTQPAQSGTDF